MIDPLLFFPHCPLPLVCECVFQSSFGQVFRFCHVKTVSPSSPFGPLSKYKGRDRNRHFFRSVRFNEHTDPLPFCLPDCSCHSSTSLSQNPLPAFPPFYRSNPGSFSFWRLLFFLVCLFTPEVFFLFPRDPPEFLFQPTNPMAHSPSLLLLSTPRPVCIRFFAFHPEGRKPGPTRDFPHPLVFLLGGCRTRFCVISPPYWDPLPPSDGQRHLWF